MPNLDLKHVFLLIALCAMNATAKEDPKFKGFSALDAAGIGVGYVQPPEALLPTIPANPLKQLGFIDQWRFDSCQQNAITAPTPVGVTVGLRHCRERFGQQP